MDLFISMLPKWLNWCLFLNRKERNIKTNERNLFSFFGVFIFLFFSFRFFSSIMSSSSSSTTSSQTRRVRKLSESFQKAVQKIVKSFTFAQFLDTFPLLASSLSVSTLWSMYYALLYNFVNNLQASPSRLGWSVDWLVVFVVVRVQWM